MRGEIEQRVARVRGHHARYAVVGAGPTVVLLHGLSGSVRWWRPILPALAERHTVYLVNLPGFGVLTRRAPRVAVGELSAWVWAWMGEIGLERAHLVGHSMGGYVAVRLAASAPEMVQRLVLVDAAGVPTARRLRGYAMPLLRTGRGLRPGFLPLLAADALRAGPLTMMRAARELMMEDVERWLPSVRARTLLIWGEKDPLVPIAAAEAFRRGIVGAELVVIPGAGHVPMYDNPNGVAEAILRFLGDAGRRHPGDLSAIE